MSGDRKQEKKPSAQGAEALPGAVGKSRLLTVKTLDKLDVLGLRSTPQFYELWYRYFEADPQVVREIDGHQGPLDEIACQKIYNRTLSPHTQELAVHEASTRIQTSITELSGMLVSAQTATNDYGASLETVPQKVKSAKTLDDLGGVIAEVLSETVKMTEKNTALEKQLEHSSQQVTELKGHLETVQREATTDSLTGIANRKAFDRRIADNVEAAAADHQPLLLLMLDIDHFKRFNDTFGHPIGDQVLGLVARTLQGNVKGQDMAARYGGEEFAILLPATSLTAGIKIADKLRLSIETKDITNRATGEKLGSITLSIGLAKYRDGEGIAGFIERADGALYEAKQAGRNRVCVALENKGSPRAG